MISEDRAGVAGTAGGRQRNCTAADEISRGCLDAPSGLQDSGSVFLPGGDRMASPGTSIFGRQRPQYVRGLDAEGRKSCDANRV